MARRRTKTREKTREKNRREVMVTHSVELPEDDIENLICAAFEGGIGYWASVDDRSMIFYEQDQSKSLSDVISEIILGGGEVTLHSTENYGTEWTLGMRKLMNGIARFLGTADGVGCISDHNGKIVFDSYDIDAEKADMIMQYALFDRLIYG